MQVRKRDDYVNYHLQLLDHYIEGVQSGNIIAGDYQRKAVDRFIEHKKKYDYKQQELIRVLRFCSLINIPHNDSIEQCTLLGWQVFLIANIFALYNGEKRLFNQALVLISKKNGKTTLIAILLLYSLLIEKTGGEVLLSAISKKQSAICLDIIKQIINISPALTHQFEIYKEAIYYNNENGLISSIKNLPFKPDDVNGLRSSFALCDEISYHKNTEMYNNILSGMINRQSPMLFAISTASNNFESAGYRLRESAINILNGLVVNNSFFALLFELDESDKIDNTDNWIKANPSLNHTVTLQALKRDYKTALNIPSSLFTFKTHHLNLWCEHGNETWIADEQIKATMVNENGRQSVLKKHLPTYIGIDLTASRDLGSIFLLQYDNKDKVFLGETYIVYPNDTTNLIRTGNIDLQIWIDEGLIYRCSTPVLDEDHIYNKLIELSSQYKIESIGIDVWGSKPLQYRLSQNLRADVNGVKQDVKNLSYPLRVVEKNILEGTIKFTQNPALRWQFGNVRIYTDFNNNIKLNKKAGNKITSGKASIDSIVALNVAMHQYLSYNLNDQMMGNLVDSYKPK